MQREMEKRADFGGAKRKLWVLLLLICLVSAVFAGSVLKNGINEKTDVAISLSDGSNFAIRTVDASDDYVKLGGIPIGISIAPEGLIVIGQAGVLTADGEKYPAAGTGIQKGDIVKALDGEPLKSVYQLKLLLEDKTGDVTLTVSRGSQSFDCTLTPLVDSSLGQRKLGLLLKEDVGGVGTLTFVTQSGNYGALGHYIQDSETGLGEELSEGYIFRTSVESVIKGEKGKAGGLVADVNRLSAPVGDISQNSLIGIYGQFFGEYDGRSVRVARQGEVTPGAAQLLTTVDGSEPKLYDIDIVKVEEQTRPEEKGMVIAVRDKELLRLTGGIVQGMSGSPILQNGALVGAVTHVFVQDPTRGYAVHSRFMLSLADAVTKSAFESVQYLEAA